MRTDVLLGVLQDDVCAKRRGNSIAARSFRKEKGLLREAVTVPRIHHPSALSLVTVGAARSPPPPVARVCSFPSVPPATWNAGSALAAREEGHCDHKACRNGCMARQTALSLVTVAAARFLTQDRHHGTTARQWTGRAPPARLPPPSPASLPAQPAAAACPCWQHGQGARALQLRTHLGGRGKEATKPQKTAHGQSRCSTTRMLLSRPAPPPAVLVP